MTRSTMGFGDADSTRVYELEVAAAKSTQKVPFAVAPRTQLKTSRKTFLPGEEVRIEDLDASDLPPMSIIQAHIRSGLLVEADHIPLAFSGKAVAVVAPKKSITSKRGILADGDAISDGDFDAATLQNLVDRGLVVPA
jgi:hypothetical protein